MSDVTFVFVTGSREGLNTRQRFQVVRELESFAKEGAQLVTGGCPTGVDADAARMLPWTGRLAVPAIWSQGRGAGPKRNELLVRWSRMLSTYGHDVRWFAFPLGVSRGTRGCAKLATEAGFVVNAVELVPVPPVG